MDNLVLGSKRISLRLVEQSDIPAIHKLHALPETDAFNTLGIPKNEDETKDILKTWIRDNAVNEIQNYSFVIEHKTSKDFIGVFGVKLSSKKYSRAEVWYKIHPQHWQNGYATEALKIVLDYCFTDLGLHRVQAGCAVDNIGSIKVLEKAGMIREGRGRKVLPLKNGWSDNFEYSILETDQRKI